MKSRFLGSLILAAWMAAPGRGDSSDISFKAMMEDGRWLYSSPLRLERSDLPAALAVSGLMGGAFATDRITYNNLHVYQDTHAAKAWRGFGDYAQFAGPMICGVLAARSWIVEDEYSKHVSWDLLESFGWASVISLTFKVALGRRRPYETSDPFELRPGTYNGSFPSGHTTAAFAAATTLAESYPIWPVVVPSYAAASAVAFSRLYADQHWGSDVAAGALLGTSVAWALRRHHARRRSAWEIHFDGNGLTLARKF